MFYQYSLGSTLIWSCGWPWFHKKFQLVHVTFIHSIRLGLEHDNYKKILSKLVNSLLINSDAILSRWAKILIRSFYCFSFIIKWNHILFGNHMSSMITAIHWYNVIEGTIKYEWWNTTPELCNDSCWCTFNLNVHIVVPVPA